MIRLKITLRDRLVYRGYDLRFEGRRGGELDWLDDHTNQRFVFTDEELAVAVAEGKAKIVKFNRFGNPDSAPGYDLSSQKAGDQSDALRRLRYVMAAMQEGFTGRIVETELDNAIQRWAKSFGEVTAPCTRSVRRWLRKAGDRPMVSKLITNHCAKGQRGSKLDLNVEEIIQWSIDTQYKKSEKLTASTVREHIRYWIDRKNESRSVPLPMPSLKAVTDAIARQSPADIMAAREGKSKAELTFDEVIRQIDPEAPLDVVELDHTKADLIVIDDVWFLPLGRPTIAVAIDRCTRMPVGVYIGFEPPSIHTVMQCLRNAILPKRYVDLNVESGKWKLKNRWKVSGFIRTLVLDRAMENLSESIREWATHICTNVVLTARRSPRQKGAVERFIRTLSADLLHEQAGTTFSNIFKRGDYDSKRRAVVTLGQLEEKIHKWIIDRFQVTPHKGFFVRDVPLRLWDELIQISPPDPVTDIDEIIHLFGRSHAATLQTWGLTLKYLEFCSPELVALLRCPNFLRAYPDRRLRFTYDTADLSKIHVYLKHEQRWITVPIAQRWRTYVTGLHWSAHIAVIAHRNRQANEATDYSALAEAKAELSGWVKEALGQSLLGTRAKAARSAGIGTVAPHGDQPATTVPGGIAEQRKAEPHGRPTARRAKPSIQKPAKPDPSRFLEVLSEDDDDDYVPDFGTRTNPAPNQRETAWS